MWSLLRRKPHLGTLDNPGSPIQGIKDSHHDRYQDIQISCSARKTPQDSKSQARLLVSHCIWHLSSMEVLYTVASKYSVDSPTLISSPIAKLCFPGAMGDSILRQTLSPQGEWLLLRELPGLLQ
jgi:hypothetical protein